MSLAQDESTVLSITENGFGKRTKVGEYRLQHRGGSGIINIKTTERNGNVVSMMTVDDAAELVLVATDGIVIRTSVKDIRTIGRNTQGVRIMKPQEGAKVSAVAKAIAEKAEDDVADTVSDVETTPADAEPTSDE